MSNVIFLKLFMVYGIGSLMYYSVLSSVGITTNVKVFKPDDGEFVEKDQVPCHVLHKCLSL